MPDPLAPTLTPAPRPADAAVTVALGGSFVATPPPPPPPDLAPGYVVLHEIARGGMGRVVAARDPRLHREVAIKFLLPSPDPAASVRFLREAEVTARLTHPGVPPVHALGRTPAGQPFLVMKLVRGRTLAGLLETRPTPAHDLPRFVAAFEQVCQAVGYAHSQGVIHRDLKPGNVMVGAFGEVQVMDWGLALLGSDERSLLGDDFEPEPTAVREFAPAAPRPTFLSDSTLTMAGTVLGTPGYMAPEQARGEAIDARADVFALGGILAAVLTGRQPVPDIRSRASAPEDGIASAAALRESVLADAADPELARLAFRCLSPDPAGRPADGKAVADEIAAYRARAEDRARRAEADRAAAVARAAADRRTRRAHAGLALAVSVTVAVLAATAWWRDRVERDRKAEADRAAGEQARVELERDGERRAAHDAAVRHLEYAADLRDRYRFEHAAEALTLAEQTGADDLADRIAAARADLATVKALDAARTKQLTWVPDKDGLGRFADATDDFRRAFVAAGFDLDGEELDPLAARVAASPIKAELVAGLEDWASAEPDRIVKSRALEVARQADPGEWTYRLRDASHLEDQGHYLALAADAEPARLTPAALVTLARLMLTVGLDPGPVLRKAHAAHPADFRIAFHLGQLYLDRDLPLAVGFYRTARALRPDHFAANINLGVALMKLGDAAAAREAYLAAERADPDSPLAAYNVGRALLATGDPVGAAGEFTRSARLLPGRVETHLELSGALDQAGDRAAARRELRTAADLLRAQVEREPENARLRTRLGGTLVDLGDLDAGVTVLRDAVRLNPHDALAHQFLGLAFMRKRDEATAARWLKRAAELAPNDAVIRTRLGGTLVNTGRVAEGLAQLRAAAALDPQNAQAHLFLGVGLARAGDLPAAAAAYRRAFELDPNIPRIHYNLGTTLLQAGDAAGAVQPLVEATRRAPADPEAWTNLGLAYARSGRPADAAPAFRAALRLVPDFPIAANGLAQIERLLAP